MTSKILGEWYQSTKIKHNNAAI